MIFKGYKSALETTRCFKEVCVCVYVCTENPLSLCFSISFLGKSDYLNPIMHSSLFFLKLCIPLPPVNQKKVVSQAAVEGESPVFSCPFWSVGPWGSEPGVHRSHEASYLFQLYKIKHDMGALRQDHFQILR